MEIRDAIKYNIIKASKEKDERKAAMYKQYAAWLTDVIVMNDINEMLVDKIAEQEKEIRRLVGLQAKAAMMLAEGIKRNE